MNAAALHDATTCRLCQRLAEGYTETKNGVHIPPFCESCRTHHDPDFCPARFRCSECHQLLPHSEQEWATLAIVRIAHGKRTRPYPTGVCHECWPTASKNVAREVPAGVSEGQPVDPFFGLGK